MEHPPALDDVACMRLVAFVYPETSVNVGINSSRSFTETSNVNVDSFLHSLVSRASSIRCTSLISLQS